MHARRVVPDEEGLIGFLGVVAVKEVDDLLLWKHGGITAGNLADADLKNLSRRGSLASVGRKRRSAVRYRWKFTAESPVVRAGSEISDS
jgi:hypothetical protein